MFERADQILIERNESEFPIHVLDFSWEGFEPSLTCFESRDYRVFEFDLKAIDFSVSKKKTCIGYFNDDDTYVPCPTKASVERYSQCPDCSAESFLPYQDCLFDPRCDGEICDLAFCKREHVLYVAFYDTRMKIGMSSTRRVEKRLIEQGADAFAIIGKLPTRKQAREAEKRISARLSIPQALRQDILLNNFARKLDESGVVARYEGLKATLSETLELSPEPLRWIDGYPIELPLAKVPKLEDPWGKHKGKLVGMKGRWVVYESNGLKALNLSTLPARFLSTE